jgi:Flp pilus assembly pilin Flp
MTSLLVRLITEEHGQDLIEYALLTAAVSVATVLGIAALGSAVNSVYTAWDTRTQDLWQPDPPAGS